MLRMSERGEIVCGTFLSPGEAAVALRHLKEQRAEQRAFFWGGYEGAERTRLLILPSYIAELEGGGESAARCYFGSETDESVKAVYVKGSGFRALSHRDYLGSLLSLGIERDRLGDILIMDDHSAVVLCVDSIRDYLISCLDRIGSDKVKCSECELSPEIIPKREFLPIRDTVASERLDCVVGALTNLSREKAQNAVRSGLCEVDHLPEERCDAILHPPCTVTVRGFGKYRVLAFDGETKKGRLRLVAEKYV